MTGRSCSSPLTISTMSENHVVPVLSGSSEQRWMLTTARRGRDWLLTIFSPDGGSWAAEGPDLFKALRELRRILDPLGIRLGVNGARRDTWASGMQCDMAEGRVVYLLRERQTGRPAQVPTLGTTALADIGTVEEQDEQHARWLDSRRTQ
jgi:hypothetical protein